MSLSVEKTKILLTLVNQSVGRFAADRDKLYAIIPSDEAFEVVAQSFNMKFAACIKIQKMAEKTIDESAIAGMDTHHFNLMINLINSEIDSLDDTIDSLIITDHTLAVQAKAAIRKHIDVLREIGRELLGMFSYS